MPCWSAASRASRRSRLRVSPGWPARTCRPGAVSMISAAAVPASRTDSPVVADSTTRLAPVSRATRVTSATGRSYARWCTSQRSSRRQAVAIRDGSPWRSPGGVAVTATPRGRPRGWCVRAAMSRSQMALARCSVPIASWPAAQSSPIRDSAGATTRSHRSASGTPRASRSNRCRAWVSSPDTMAACSRSAWAAQSRTRICGRGAAPEARRAARALTSSSLTSYPRAVFLAGSSPWRTQP